MKLTPKPGIISRTPPTDDAIQIILFCASFEASHDVPAAVQLGGYWNALPSRVG